MRPIPPKLREEMAEDPFYKHCAVGGDCEGRIEWDHAWIYAGRQINEKWAIIPVCSKHHASIKHKPYRQLIALNRATEEDLEQYPKKDWKLERLKLENGQNNTQR